MGLLVLFPGYCRIKSCGRVAAYKVQQGRHVEGGVHGVPFGIAAEHRVGKPGPAQDVKQRPWWSQGPYGLHHH